MLLERRKFEFEDFLLDTREKILLHDGKPVSITPKAFQLLLVLVENHGHLVEKDELMNSVWADSFVEEANLAFTIRLLRKALNDDAQKPRFIETVPKRGYRFIAGVKCVETKEKIDKFGLIDNSALPSNGENSAPSKNPRYVGESESQSTAAVVALADWRKEAGADQLSESSDAVKASSENDSPMAEKLDTIDSSGRNKTILAAAAILLLAVSIALGYYFFSAKNT